MVKQYLKQALYMLRENRLISVISVAGTALSIAMIMVVVLVFQVQFASFYPENNRGRMMYVENGTEVRSNNGWNRGSMSAEAVKECFYTLQVPEAVSGYALQLKPLSIPGKRMYKGYEIKYTDPGFWQVFSFRFLSGKPFTQADFDAAIPVAVVSESVARKLYGSTEVVGKSVIIDLAVYTICGVVEDASRAANTAFASVWVPYTTDRILLANTSRENMTGAFFVCLLARQKGDFEAIRQELDRQVERYNGMKQDNQINFMGGPITRLDVAIGSEAQVKVALKDYLLETGLLLLFLLLVPALNLLGVTQSAIQKRRAEMGVRKAFGATTGTLLCQVLYENGLTTLIGGGVGFGLSLLFLSVGKDFLLQSANTALSGEMVFQPMAFGAALLFCLLLNLLSAGLPAWRIARQKIVIALKDGEEWNH
ncbi:ABC transporter permease [Parabacteroides sp. ASD2025]|uniref:ABC transporter permease n=1 Tax=Parabacteroides sp. ASD2025 TaxID=3415987 RepID=UPI003CEB7BC8